MITPAWRHAGVLALITCCLPLAATASFAMWAALSDQELVSSSELIVIGEWRENTPIKKDASAAQTDTIAIREVLKGDAPVSLRIVRPRNQAPRSSSDLIFRSGDQGLWFLRQSPENTGLYLIDHPQRFVPASGNEERIRSLKRLISP